MRIVKQGGNYIIKWKDKKKKSFTLDWFKEFYWSQNPFVTKIPLPPSKFIAGYGDQRKKLNLFILEDQKIATITGPKGSGKSMLLKWLYYELLNYRSRIYSYYIDYKINLKKELIKLLVYPLFTPLERFYYYFLYDFPYFRQFKRKFADNKTSIFVEKIFSEDLSHAIKILIDRLGNKKIILLIDYYQNLSVSVKNTLHHLIESYVPIEVVVADEFIEDLKAEMKIKISTLSLDDAKSMIQKRIEAVGGEGIYPFSDSDFKKVYNTTDKTPKDILEKFHIASVKAALNEVAKKEERLSSYDETFESIPEVEKGVSAVEIKSHKEKQAFHIPEEIKEDVKKLSKKMKKNKHKTKEEQETEKIINDLAKELN